MTTPAGDITLGDVAAELGIALPLTLGDARVIVLRGGGTVPVTLGELRSKSRFTVDFTIGAEVDAAAGSPTSGNRRVYRVLTAVVVGSGNYTYAWSVVGTATYSAFFSSTAASTAQWSQSYNTNEEPFSPMGETVTLKLTVTDTTLGLTLSATHAVSLG
jgi:hypothetical protein